MFQSNTAQLMPQTLDRIRLLCELRDLRYSKKFYRRPYFDVIRPLIETIRLDGGIGCFVHNTDKLLPEAAATCLLALYHLRIADEETIQSVQNYLITSNAEVVRFLSQNEQAQDTFSIDIANCAWSANQGKNVWSTSQILWALVGTKYKGKYEHFLRGSIDWLLEEQHPSGGWALIAGKDNRENVFITSVTVYALNLSLKYYNFSQAKQGQISDSINNGCKFIIKNREAHKHYWSYDQNGGKANAIEPTTTAMAIWALNFCATKQDDVKEIVAQGVVALRKSLGQKDTWETKVALEGFIPESRLDQVFHGYPPSIAFILLRLGVPPNDDMIVRTLNFLINTRTEQGWGFQPSEKKPQSVAGFVEPEAHYVEGGFRMTFITALALWTIEEWHKQLVRHNIAFQMNAGNIRLQLATDTSYRLVNRNQLAFLLISASISLICIYFVVLSVVFHEPFSELVSNLSIKDVSDLFDSILKLLFLPTVIIALNISFFMSGRFSFAIVKRIWDRLTG